MKREKKNLFFKFKIFWVWNKYIVIFLFMKFFALKKTISEMCVSHICCFIVDHFHLDHKFQKFY